MQAKFRTGDGVKLHLLTLSFFYKLEFILFVMTLGAQTVGSIAVYDCHEIGELIHGLAGKSDTVLEFDRGMCFFSNKTT